MTLLHNNLRQVVHTPLPLSPSSIIWYQRKLGGKQAYRVVHQPVSRGLAVFADAWLSGWLAETSADLRETVAHQRCVMTIDDALYKSTYFRAKVNTNCLKARFSCLHYASIERLCCLLSKIVSHYLWCETPGSVLCLLYPAGSTQ